MKKILFVDDEPNVIQGLKRMLRSTLKHCEVFFALSGPEALDIMSRIPIDIIVTDMRMPGMDGAQLLELVQQQYPSVIRIVLSGHSDEEMIVKSVRTAHQFLAKPCSPEELCHALERAFRLRGLVTNQGLAQLVAGIKDLPSLPDSCHELLKELNSDEPSLKRIGEIVLNDLTMTARVLQLVNSAFFGLPRKISNPQQAVTLLGVRTIKALVVYVGIFSGSKCSDDMAQELELLWRHSLEVGGLAKEISIQASGGGKLLADDALMGGVLHDIGKLVLWSIPYYRRLYSTRDVNRADQVKREYDQFGVSHAEIGAYLLGLWGFADNIVEMAAYHHKPSKAISKGFSTLTAVHVANALVTREETNADSSVFDQEHLNALHISDKIPEWQDIYRKTIRRRDSR